MTGSDMQGQDQSAPSHPVKTEANLPLILTKPPPTLPAPRLLHLPSSSRLPVLAPPVPPRSTRSRSLQGPRRLADYAPVINNAPPPPCLAHKAKGVLCIMLTIKDSISSLILFTSAWQTSCCYTYHRESEGRGEEKGGRSRRCCWSNKVWR